MSSPPDAERWRRTERLLDAALDLPPDARSAYLRDACPDDEVRREVEALLTASERDDGFLESGALAWSAPLISPSEAGVVPARLGRFEVRGELGRGGMGVVLLAHDPRLDREVAIKLLPPHLAADPAARERLEREARAASGVEHPNVVAVYDVGETPEGRPFIVMAYHPGRTLRSILEAGPLPSRDVLALGRQVASGLAAAHARGVVHRDVKPANVLVDHSGHARVVDFGIAYAGGAASDRHLLGMGTAAYMSPEQAKGQTPDPRSDVWALGVLLAEMATGTRPFGGDAVDTVLQAVVAESPELPDDLSGSLRDIVARCLRKEPGERPADAGEVEALLAAVDRPTRQRRAWAVAAAVVTVAAVGWGVWRTVSAGDGATQGPGPLGGLAVLPLEPLAPDTALTRLGRELSVTLTATLSSVGDEPLVDAVALLGRIGQGGSADAARAALGLGAERVIRGSLIRVGTDSVRAEVELAPARGGRSLARASASAPLAAVTELSDSLSIGILRGAWTRGEVPTPSLAGLSSASVPALSAYLAGERAMAGGDFVEAVRSFETAFALDSTFWFAYWRSLYPRSHEGAPSADSAALAGLWSHRATLPRQDRLILEAWREPSLTRRLERARVVTDEYPTYWPGWWEYADRLIHDGPYVGTTEQEARTAIERVLELQPRFAPAWQHRLWLDINQRDTAAIAESLTQLATLASPSGQFLAQDELRYYRALAAFVTDGGGSVARAEREAAGLIADLPPISPATLAHGLIEFGLPRAQVELGEALIARSPPRAIEAAMRISIAKSWAARGDWDAALAHLDSARAISRPDEIGIPAARLAVAGSLLGGLGRDRARPLVAAAQPATQADSAEARWLAGVFAFVEGNAAALDEAADSLDASAYPHAGLLVESLRGFRLGLDDLRAGAEAIAALEQRKADRYGYVAYAPALPFLSGLHRLWAGRALAEAGELERARRLLTWHAAIRWGRTNPEEWANRTLEPLALLERAHIAERQGRREDARRMYAEFLGRFDRPDETGEALVVRARAGLRRVGELGSDR